MNRLPRNFNGWIWIDSVFYDFCHRTRSKSHKYPKTIGQAKHKNTQIHNKQNVRHILKPFFQCSIIDDVWPHPIFLYNGIVRNTTLIVVNTPISLNYMCCWWFMSLGIAVWLYSILKQQPPPIWWMLVEWLSVVCASRSQWNCVRAWKLNLMKMLKRGASLSIFNFIV